MRPGLLLPRFYSTEAINAEKIDAHVKLMAEQINGGLTAANVAPSSLAASVFSEGNSVAAVATEVQNTGKYPVCVVPSACRLLGVGVGFWRSTSSSTLSTAFTLYVNGAAAFVIPIGPANTPSSRFTTSVTSTGFQYAYGVPSATVSLSSGDNISVDWIVGAEVVKEGGVTVFLSFPHSS